MTATNYGKISLLTLLALVAFAANSVLCRLALGVPNIDASSFTSVRLVSGAAVLLLLSLFAPGKGSVGRYGDWFSSAMLFLYAATFSFAYLTLDTGTGALILFGAVQATMIISAIVKGERPRKSEWIGLILAMCGLTYLVLPGLEAPPLFGALLMTLAGVAWGFYTLKGKGVSNPLLHTRGNFVRTIPLVLILSLVFISDLQVSTEGIVLAAASGGIASGIGYAVWYAALKGLTATRAGVVQLSVPVLAAAGGVLFLSEVITGRLVLAAVLILGGVAVAVVTHRQ